ncbi:hypothetical protein BH23CHL2_BH23CHL2_09100 [soil metagenome]
MKMKTGNGASYRSSARIVGREREREQLRELLGQAVDGRGALALVRGEAGIGKSTLVDDLRDAAEGMGCLALTGACYDLETTPPYGPWIEILRAYSGEDPELPSVPGELRVGGVAGIDSQAALFDLTGRFFAEVAHARPLTLILEDIHWADPASLDFLRYLARTASNAPLLLVATYRDDEIASEHPLYQLLPTLARESGATRIELQRLSAEDVSELIGKRYRLSSVDQGRLVGYLDRLAEGNPFFITELLHALEERGTIQPVAGGWRLDELTETGVPSFVKQVIARRMAALNGPARIAIDIAAVAGQDASLDLIEALHGGETSELDDALQRAFDHQLLFIQPDGRTIRFSHALFRETVYESIPPLRRRSLHRQIGEQIVGRIRPDPERVARHFYQAADERALDWLARAAEQAQTLFAPETVATRCRQAIDLADRLKVEPPLEIYRLQGLALETIGEFDGALQSHETALDRARAQGAQRSEWQATLDLAALWASRDYARAGEYCQQAVDLARTLEDPSALGHSLNQLGNWQANAGHPDDGIRNHREALEVFAQANDLHGKAVTLDLLAIAYILFGDTATALQYYEEAIPLLRSVGDRKTLSSALATAGGISRGMGVNGSARLSDLPQSLGSSPMDLIQEGAQIASSVGWRSGLSYAQLLWGIAAVNVGEVRSGLRSLNESVRIAEEINHTQWFVTAHLHLALAHLHLRVPSVCLSHVRATQKALPELASNVWQMMADGMAASAYIESGDLETARAALPAWKELTEQSTIPLVWAGWLGSIELALADKRYELALEIVERLIHLSSGISGYLSPDVLLLRGLAMLACGRAEEAETSLLQACEVAEEFDFQLSLWRIQAALRKLYLAEGRIDDADAAGETALHIIDQIAEQIDDEDVRTTFLTNARAEVPGDPPYAISRSGELTFGGLTPREIEVLQLVARGMTNDEVSERLFISPRTVGQHLRSIYNKLDVNNRTAASRIATEHGLV